MTQRTIRTMWVTLLAVVLLAPLVARSATSERNGFWPEITTVTGLLATSLLVVVVVMTSRIRSITRAFGLATTQAMHRYLGLLTVSMMGVHVGAVLIDSPDNVALLAPGAPLRATAGLVALVGSAALGGLATLQTRRNYEVWRWVHLLLTLVILAGTATHIVLLNHLVRDPYAGAMLGALAGVVGATLLGRWILLPLAAPSFVVDDVRVETPSVSTVTLRPPSDRRPLRFAAGQFVWLRLHRFPRAEHPLTISSAEQDGTRPSFTFRHRGPWTRDRFAQVRPGDRVWLDGPHGAMTPEPTGVGLVLVAGGIGITPTMSILRTLARHGDPRAIRVVLVNRPGDEFFGDELAALGTRLQLTVTDASGMRISAALLEGLLPPAFVRNQLEYFACGPVALVDDTTLALSELGIPHSRVHTELFDVA